ncbi:peptidylprolyl isomerase [Calothrix rhizosoleniae]|uniref:peptidylprolyl isomerase n=1 Tax=Calothrix rhizosoleniae TaxID=888997 RepID=UPI000B4A0CC6|nr:peptidylprolyl isomerase [Calothrix rhizosoleniae]
MTTAIRVNDQIITTAEVIPRLTGYGMLPQFLGEVIIEQAISSIECSSEENDRADQEFCTRLHLLTDIAHQAWLQQHGMTPEQFHNLALRRIKLEKFKQATWSNQVESYFQKHKAQLDRVIYSIIRTHDPDVARELYFRLQEGEQSFAELAREYSQGPEAQIGGLVGPVELGVPHPVLAGILSSIQVGQVSLPTHLQEWVVIVRLDKFIHAQLDELMHHRLVNELFSKWLQEKIQELTAVYLRDTSEISTDSDHFPSLAAQHNLV